MPHRQCASASAVWLALAFCFAASAVGQVVEPPQRMTVAANPYGPAPIDYWSGQPQPSNLYPAPWNDPSWKLQVVPDGLIYHSYLAGGREPRFASIWAYQGDQGWFWDVTLGGRVGILRWGTEHVFRPDGWQLDIEGAAFPRLDLEHDRDLLAADYRFGIPLTYGQGPWQYKLAYYHISSHVGDEFLIQNPGFVPNNYSRDAAVVGVSVYPLDSVRLYGEVGYAFYTSGPAEPWEFQFGAEFSPSAPTGLAGAPFAAINGHVREEVNYSGSVTVQAGWQWRGCGAGQLFRAGVQYFNGATDQYSFLGQNEEYVAGALWYDY